MKAGKLALTIIGIITAVILIAIPSYSGSASAYSLTDLRTDKSSYNIGDRITFTGRVILDPGEKMPMLAFIVYSPENAGVGSLQFDAREDGSFSYIFFAQGKDLPTGYYRIVHISSDNKAETQYFLSGVREPGPAKVLPIQFKLSTELDGNEYLIKGSSMNLTVNSFKINPNKSIYIDVTGKAGSLEVDIPRGLINGKITAVTNNNGESLSAEVHQNFNIIMDANYNAAESMKEYATNMKIKIPDGTTRVEILGLNVVPEFPIGFLFIPAIVFGIVVGISRLRLTKTIT